jgi:hypothetical protein
MISDADARLRVNSQYPQNPFSLFRVWFIALVGCIAGAIIQVSGARLAGGSLGILGFAPLFLYWDRRLMPGLLFGPLSFMYLFHALGYAIGPLWQLYLLGHLTTAIEDGLVPAQWGGVLGLATMAVAYPQIFQAVSRRVMRRKGIQKRQKSDYFRWPGYALLLAAVAFLTVSYGFVVGATNRLASRETTVEIATLVSMVAELRLVAFFFLGCAAARRRGWWLPLWASIFGGFALFTFLDGGRGPVAFAAIFSALGLVWGGVSYRKIILCGALAAILYVPLCGVVLVYRGHYGSNLKTTTSFSQRLEDMKEAANRFKLQKLAPSSSLASGAETFMENVTAQAVDQVFLLTPQSIPFAGLEGLERIVYAWIPKIVMPNRPTTPHGDGNELAIQYGAAYPGTTGSYMPAVGDGYRRFGWPGIVLLYLFSAAIYGPILALCWHRRERRERMAMVIFLLFSAPGIWSATLLDNFYLILWTFPKYWICFWMLSRLQDRLAQFSPSREPRSTLPRKRRLITDVSQLDAIR